jgi:hypothetical protein
MTLAGSLSPAFTPAIDTLCSLPSVALIVAMPLSSTAETVPSNSAAKMTVESKDATATAMVKIVASLQSIRGFSSILR